MMKKGSKNISGVFIGSRPFANIYVGDKWVETSLDPDARAYIKAVEDADGQPLEMEVKKMVNDYVTALKNSESPNAGVSNWDAIKVHGCIPIARTLSGFLVPLKGGEITNVNFVSDDYERGVGLAANTGKYVRLPFTLQSTAVDNVSIFVYCTSPPINEGIFGIIGAGHLTSDGNVRIGINANPNMLIRNRNTNLHTGVNQGNTTGFIGTSRHETGSYISRYNNQSYISYQSATPAYTATPLYCYAINGSNGSAGNGGRYVFACAGEAVDLEEIDSITSSFITKLQEFISDPDALDYIKRVEMADGQPLEKGVKSAIYWLVRGLKSDPSPNPGVSNWDACKLIYIFNIARTLEGALTPLKGSNPVNQNFVQSDLIRGFGLLGNGINKRLVMPRNINADPQNNKHLSAYVTIAAPITGSVKCIIGGDGNTQLLLSSTGKLYPRIHNATGISIGPVFQTGFIGASRDTSSQVNWVSYNEEGIENITSSAPSPVINYAFARHNAYFDGAISFLSDGESVSLISMREQLTTFHNAINSII